MRAREPREAVKTRPPNAPTDTPKCTHRYAQNTLGAVSNLLSLSKRASRRRYTERRDEIAEARGVDPTKKHLLMTAEQAAEEYKRKDKKSKTALGGEVFSKHNLFNAYDKRTKNIKVNEEEYAAAKAADPNFYTGADNLSFGQNGAVPQDNIDRMAEELEAGEGGEWSARGRSCLSPPSKKWLSTPIAVV